MSTVKSKKLQVGTDATSTNNFTIYQPSTPDGTLRIGQGDADSPTEVARITSTGIDRIGLGQTYTDVTSSRALGVTYTNSTSAPIFVSMQPNSAVSSSFELTVAGNLAWVSNATPSDTGNNPVGIVPAGATYDITKTAGTATIVSWRELR